MNQEKPETHEIMNSSFTDSRYRKIVVAGVCLFLIFFFSDCLTKVPYLGDISATDLRTLTDQGKIGLVLDVRSPEEYERGHIKGAMNITHAELPYAIKEIEHYKNREIVVYCRSGRRAGLAVGTLQANGFMKILQLRGHFNNWMKNNFPVEVN